MSHFSTHSYDPESDTIRMATWIDDYFRHYVHGVQFDADGPVYTVGEVSIPNEEDVVWVREKKDETH